MKTFTNAALAIAAGLVCSTAVDAAVISDLFNTGVDAVGTPLGDDVNDPHYAIILDPSGLGDATLTDDGFPIPPWLANDGNSRWIGPDDGGDAIGPAGVYAYQTSFTLPANADLTSVLITGNWAADDGGGTGGIGVNTVDTLHPPAVSFGIYAGFVLNDANSDFVVGVNTIEFVLSNGGGPTGLRVDDMVGDFLLVPEPASLGLIALAGVSLLGRRRRQA